MRAAPGLDPKARSRAGRAAWAGGSGPGGGPRLRADIPLTGGPVGLVAWVGPERLLAIQEVCCDERQQLLTIDARRRGILAAVPLGGTVLRVARTPHELVTLVAPPNANGVPRLDVAGGDGIVRTVALDRLRAGVQLTDT